MSDQTQQTQESPPPRQDHDRRRRAIMRMVMSFWAIVAGVILIVFFKDYRVQRILPVPWLGYLCVAVGVLAILGLNVFWGGPLDKRLDRDR